MKVQFIKNYFRGYNNKQFRKYNIIDADYSAFLSGYVYCSKYNFYLIPPEYLKKYKH